MNTKKGFTLLELLIVLVITSSFLAFGYTRYRDFARRQEISIAKREIISDMRQAQKNAIIGNKPAGCSAPLKGYVFDITSAGPPAKYSIYSLCEGSPTHFEENAVTLGNDIVLSASIDPILFKPLALGTDIPSGSTAVLTIKNPGVTKVTGTVSVTQVGEIQ